MDFSCAWLQLQLKLFFAGTPPFFLEKDLVIISSYYPYRINT